MPTYRTFPYPAVPLLYFYRPPPAVPQLPGVAARQPAVPRPYVFPPARSSRVSLHVNLPYPDYYGAVAGGLGLLPLLGSPDYLATKISSSVITSLVTGLPLMVRRYPAEWFTVVLL